MNFAIRPPDHIAIIMDGNGRWARKRFLPREAGHIRGIGSARKIIRAAREIGVKYLTLYTFSTENWRRPESEVRHLMVLFRRFCQADISKLHGQNVRVRFIGTRAGIDPDIADIIREAETLTASNTQLNLSLAFNYGSREELSEAARSLAQAALDGRLDPASITPETIGASLQSTGLPDVDLLIRSGGERRLSNFLLWQAAYAELVFSDKLWPDFDRDDLLAAIEEFHRRDRRFGGVSAEAAKAGSSASISDDWAPVPADAK